MLCRKRADSRTKSFGIDTLRLQFSRVSTCQPSEPMSKILKQDLPLNGGILLPGKHVGATQQHKGQHCNRFDPI
jgi:hypothetical protein